jgi:hypothetical protein
MDQLKLRGRSLGQVFNVRLGRACIGRAIVCMIRQPNSRLKIRPKKLLGSILLAIVPPDLFVSRLAVKYHAGI